MSFYNFKSALCFGDKYKSGSLLSTAIYVLLHEYATLSISVLIRAEVCFRVVPSDVIIVNDPGNAESVPMTPSAGLLGLIVGSSRPGDLGASPWRSHGLCPCRALAVWGWLCGGSNAPAHGPRRPRLRVGRLVQDWLLCRAPVQPLGSPPPTAVWAPCCSPNREGSCLLSACLCLDVLMWSEIPEDVNLVVL